MFLRIRNDPEDRRVENVSGRKTTSGGKNGR
jgi:hypothetical protein